MNSTSTPLIKIEKLSVVFNAGKTNEAKSLDNIDLEIYPREYLILFGPSGCGKSTLLNVITGLLKASSGKVEIEGRDIATYSEKEKLEFHRRRIGMIFQAYFLVSTLSIVDNVCLPRAFSGGDSLERRRDGINLLRRFGIEDQAEKFPSDLSGGQRQRVAIARSLINSPSIIIADEPVGNLDSKAAYNVLTILKELNEIDKKLVILVTHDPSHLDYGDRVVYMRDGKITKIVEVLKKKVPIDEEEQAEALDKKRSDEYQKEYKEHISPDLLTLMRSFNNLTTEQLGTLLIPFKAQQIFSHIFFHIPEVRIDSAKKLFQDFIAGGITIEDLKNRLTEEEEKGGAGWDGYHAKRLIAGIEEIYEQVKKIDFVNIDKSANDLSEYLINKFKLRIGEMEKIKFVEYVKMRVANELSMDELLGLVDRPVVKGGVGLDRRTAVKVAREMEIIMLARYSM